MRNTFSNFLPTNVYIFLLGEKGSGRGKEKAIVLKAKTL